MGATVVIVARDQGRGKTAVAEIQVVSGNPKVDLLTADLASQKAVRQLASNLITRYDALHVLINNAGIALTKRAVTEEGFEKVFAVNYLAPFLLTNLLLDVLKTNAPARVVNVAGDFHRKASLNFDDLMSERDYNGFRANNQAKLALILFTYELARRLEGTGVTVNALHPGAVATDAVSKDPDVPAFGRFMYSLFRPFFLSPEKGAETPLFLASSQEVEGVTGKYFIKKRAVPSSPESYDLEIARRLWETSIQLIGLNN
jgi:NAD(P)-dependent dehydrogenase (short-subunit alcohol dehydrogenase family)